MEKPAALEELIQALRCLPGVGPKSAQRMAYHLLQRDQKGAERLSHGLTEALGRIRHCARCNTFTEAEKELFSHVVELAEKEGKPVELLVVPAVNPFDAMVQTAGNLKASRLVTGVSAIGWCSTLPVRRL